MGMYTDFRLKCVLKDEFLPVIQKLENDNANWETNSNWGWESLALAFPQYPFLKEWSVVMRADQIPFSDNEHAIEGNVWSFECRLKNYCNEIETFASLVLSKISNEIILAETHYEEDIDDDCNPIWKPLY